MFSSFNVSKPSNKSVLTVDKNSRVDVAIKSRSKTGCFCCRKKKKKCDEQHPVCGLCKIKGQDCIWEIQQYLPKNVSLCNDSKNDGTLKSLVKTRSGVRETTKRKELSINAEVCKTIDELNEYLHLYSMIEPQLWPVEKHLSELPLVNVPSSPFNLYLDDYGVLLLLFFVERVSKLLSVSPDSSNYFLKTFYTLGISEEAILNALAAWGAVFLEGAEGCSLQIYLEKASTLMHERYFEKKELSKYDNYVCLCYYLIIIGVYVCSGDIKQWYKHFHSCIELFERNGGIIRFYKNLDSSNDVKWLLSNFQYHDILSSTSLAKGTMCTMNNYNDLFKFSKLLDSGDYGVDPYQGCIQPLYLLMGEIINTKVQLQNERKNLEKFLADFDGDINSSSINRLQFYKKSEEKYFDLISKIEFCNPNSKQIASLEATEHQQHHDLFELYRSICKIYVMLYIKQTQPKSYDVQNLLVNSLMLVNILINSKLMGALNMAMLVCGVSCCTEFDRETMRLYFTKLYSAYRVGNLKKIWEIVEEAWRRNPTGNLCIDWLDICDDFGWVLSVC